MESALSYSAKPGEFVIKTLFLEFANLAEKKIDAVLSSEQLEKSISKSLQRGEDPVFDQLLTSIGSVSEHCLPSLLQAIFAWYERQLSASSEYLERKGLKSDSQSRATGKANLEICEKPETFYILEKRDLCLEFIFCLFLIEVLKQLPLHPGHEDLINYIENLAFKHFKYREGAQNNPNIQNINVIADLYAEVIGVLAQVRFQSVRKRFMTELKELKSKDASVVTTQSIISLLMGMKFFRIKMVPIEEFEASFEFMHECANYFVEVKDKDIKHALAGLFVEVLVPVAATVKNEVNVPCLKHFVEMLYPLTLDLCLKKKHTLALFPLVTCLLCVSQKAFFLKNWHCFLSICLSHLKNRDSKLSRVALESLYRLLWVYMIRIKCESNTATQTKLQSIVNSLFPKGSKAVVPRDTPLNIFVKIIQFIASERLDFAMKGIVYDLLSVDRPIKVILAPERMSIGLRAFLVVADSLQQKEGEPPMPRTTGVMPSGNTLRVKKTFLNKMLTEKMARNIGVNDYYPHVRKSLNDILRALDVQFGRPLMMTTVQNINKEPDDMITGERKPKIDLFRTCVAAIPRLIPDGMSRQDLIDLLSRLTVHMDEEMRGLAFQSLQNIINDFPDWREDVVEGFFNFLLTEVNDTFTTLLDNGLRMLLQLLTSWKTSIQSNLKATVESNKGCRGAHTVSVLHQLEGIGLVMLCGCRQPTRRLAAHILKETRFLLKLFAVMNETEEPVLDIIDKVCPEVIESYLHLIPANERPTGSVDLQWLAEKNGSLWMEDDDKNAWNFCLTEFVGKISNHSSAILFAWNLTVSRMNVLFGHFDNPIDRASVLLRTTIKKSNERDYYLSLWKYYLSFACTIAPTGKFEGSGSPDIGEEKSRLDTKSPLSRGISASNLFNQLLPMIKSEHGDIRSAVIFGLSHTNSGAIKDFMEEIVPYIRDAIDRNKENSRKRKQREFLRIQLGSLLEKLAKRGVFGSIFIDKEAGGLNNTFVEYIDGVRLYLENENDKDSSGIVEIRTKFCGFIYHLVEHFPCDQRGSLLSRDLRNNLFYLYASWSGPYGSCLLNYKGAGPLSKELEFPALQAMSAVFYCGPVFDSKCLSEDFPIYEWLESMLASDKNEIVELGAKTLVLLLDLNPDIGSLLDWLVDCCYIKDVQVSDACFQAIVDIFSLRDYPCDHYVAILNVTLLNVGCPRAEVHERALELWTLLKARFWGEDNVNERKDNYSEIFPITQAQICEQMSIKHRELTMPFFSEITYRLKSARPCLCRNMLSYLRPWCEGLDLVENVDWRFSELTEMVLNNLFYATVKWGDEYDKEIETIWCALCGSNEGNMRVIIRYLFIVTGLGLNELLEYSKRVILYLARASPERLMDEMMIELQTAETLNMVIERMESPPFFRITHVKREPHSDEETVIVMEGSRSTLEQGTLHTKRHSTEGGVDREESGRSSVCSFKEDCSLERREKKRSLPMPEFGGYYAPLIEFLPEGVPVMGFHRCNLALILLSDLIDRLAIDWSPHLPSMLHVAFLGLDHPKPFVHEHCKEVLIALLRIVIGRGESEISRILLRKQNGNLCFTEPWDEEESDECNEEEDLVKCLIEFLVTKKGTLWNCEDITAKVWSIRSASQLGCLLEHVLSVFKETVMGDHLEERWAEVALQCALSCSSRHYAGRSLQIFRVIKVPINSRMLADILSRLVETVAEQGEDMQGYVTELMLTLESAVDSLNCGKRMIKEYVKNLFKSTPNLSKENNTEEQSKIGKRRVKQEKLDKEEKEKEKKKDKRKSIYSKQINHLNEKSLNDTSRDCCSLERNEGKVNRISITPGSFEVFPHDKISPDRQFNEKFGKKSPISCASTNSNQMSSPSSSSVKSIDLIEKGRSLESGNSNLLSPCSSSNSNLNISDFDNTLNNQIFNRSNSSDSSPTRSSGLYSTSPNMTHHNLNSDSQPMNINRTSRYSDRGSISSSMKPTYSVPIFRVPRPQSHNESDLNFQRAHSVSSLAPDESSDRTKLLSQLFWISIAMLETDYEHEFSLALRLLSKILGVLDLGKSEVVDIVESIRDVSGWKGFVGVQAMVLKGVTCASTHLRTMNVLGILTNLLGSSLIDPSGGDGFAIHVIGLLPYLLCNYDEPDELCIKASKDFANWCCERYPKTLDNLATVMTLYLKKAFSKEAFQWKKCVVKYLYDAYPHTFPGIVTFLIEVLDKSIPTYTPHIISILHCILFYMDTSAMPSLNSDLHKIAHKYIESPLYKDILSILKLVVSRSSSLVVPHSIPVDCVSISSGASWGDDIRRELPGRTIEFTFDADVTPIIGRKLLGWDTNNGTSSEDSNFCKAKEKPDDKSICDSIKSTTKDNYSDHERNKGNGEFDGRSTREILKESGGDSPKKGLFYNHSFNESNWKKPWYSQARTRERLIGLLRSFGKSVGLPKSPSVIFSQSSIERQSSLGSTEEEEELGDVSEGKDDELRLFKDFDFLEYEEGEGDVFNWGVRRRSLGGEEVREEIVKKEEGSSDEEGSSPIGSNDLSIGVLYNEKSE